MRDIKYSPTVTLVLRAKLIGDNNSSTPIDIHFPWHSYIIPRVEEVIILPFGEGEFKKKAVVYVVEHVFNDPKGVLEVYITAHAFQGKPAIDFSVEELQEAVKAGAELDIEGTRVSCNEVCCL